MGEVCEAGPEGEVVSSLRKGFTGEHFGKRENEIIVKYSRFVF